MDPSFPPSRLAGEVSSSLNATVTSSPLNSGNNHAFRLQFAPVLFPVLLPAARFSQIRFPIGRFALALPRAGTPCAQEVGVGRNPLPASRSLAACHLFLARPPRFFFFPLIGRRAFAFPGPSFPPASGLGLPLASPSRETCFS